MHLCNRLYDHRYIRMHLVFYAIRSIGALHHSPPPYLTVLLVFVELVPLETGLKARRRIRIHNLVTAPLVVFTQQIRESYFMQKEETLKMHGMPESGVYTVLVTPFSKEKEHNKDKTTRIMTNETLIRHGYIGASPEKVALAFSIRLFEAYHQIHRVCPRYSLSALSTTLTNLHETTRRASLAEQLSTAYDR
ncbi:hypothetical protein B0H13DRAFT_2480009 [Mycena leptocephala]|nr:hypothetical protein B0H13DRAFT_2480009 [Mycena leptocephala]